MSTAVRLEVLQPATRADCINGPRPCPWVRCRHHLLVEGPLVGRSRLQRSPAWLPGFRVHPAARAARSLTEALSALPESCALDVAADGGVTLAQVGTLLGCTRERARQIEARALERLDPIARRLTHGG